MPVQLEKVGAAYNLLLEVDFEAGELLRQSRGLQEERICMEFKSCVERAMEMLLEARRKAGTYCG